VSENVENIRLNKPWMVAVWPGMGHVAISAGYYLMAKLGVHLLAEFRPLDLFDVEHVEVKGGLVRTGRLPRSRLFVWRDPAGAHDIVIFIGEAQPPMGKYTFCRRLIEFARELAVERVFTFAAMATEMRPEHPSRVFGAAADAESLAELKRLEVEILEEGHIGGLNGVLLGVAAENDLHGACLLGEIPQVFAHLPFPKASLAVLETFATMARLEIDLAELRQQAQAMDTKLGALFARMEQAISRQEPTTEDALSAERAEENRLDPEDEQRIERLFEQARKDRSKAYELKRELDRLGVFREYEDRFLDLFKRPD
jgi:proteasome assembly chaperone (PAC2) family protein